MESFVNELYLNALAVLKKYTVTAGRASRKEFWLFALANFAVGIVLAVLSQIPFLGKAFAAASTLLGVAVAIPGITVGVRRLHDTGKSGWLTLLALIPIVGGIAVLALCAMQGTPGENKYGPAPAQSA